MLVAALDPQPSRRRKLPDILASEWLSGMSPLVPAPRLKAGGAAAATGVPSSAAGHKRKAAEMFASGLCASYDGGGVLLEATAPARAIIAGPSAHSGWLDEHEHVVDPSRLTNIRPVAWFPQN